MLDDNISYIRAHLDSNYNYTGLVRVSTKDGQTRIMNDIELKELVNENLKKLNEETISLLSFNYSRYQTFKYFIDTNFEELRLLITKEKGDVADENYQSRKSYHWFNKSV